MLALCLQVFHSLLVAFFLLYVVLEVWSIYKSKNTEKGNSTSMNARLAFLADEQLPAVSVLLPVYNEKYVVAKLIDAVCALQYPKEKLEILLLDDSTDETCQIAVTRIEYHSQRGIPIRRVQRETRMGDKAGNLNFGITHIKGNLVAIFDADCLPPTDFLIQAVPYFADEKTGFLQSGIQYSNRNASFLTQFQAMLAGHKEDVTKGLSREGLMASLTGSSCIWRRSCIESIGGISTDTITEDVDMGYKAQLDSWKYVFLPQVVSLAELPETMGAFRVQRHRWARGLIHNAFRHFQSMFATPMPVLSRLHAISLMFSSLLLASFYVLLLLCLPVALLTDSLGAFFHLSCAVFLFSAVVWAWCNTSGHGASRGAGNSSWKKLGNTLGYVVMFFPVALYYFVAAVQVFAGINGCFHRTPKGSGRKKISHPPVNSLLVFLEVFSLVYALASLGIGLNEGNYWVALFSALASSGFALVLYFTWLDTNAT